MEEVECNVPIALEQHEETPVRIAFEDGTEELAPKPTRSARFSAKVARIDFAIGSDEHDVAAREEGSDRNADTESNKRAKREEEIVAVHEAWRDAQAHLHYGQVELRNLSELLHMVETHNRLGWDPIKTPKTGPVSKTGEALSRLRMKQRQLSNASTRLREEAERMKRSASSQKVYYRDVQRLRRRWNMRSVTSRRNEHFSLIDYGGRQPAEAIRRAKGEGEVSAESPSEAKDNADERLCTTMLYNQVNLQCSLSFEIPRPTALNPLTPASILPSSVAESEEDSPSFLTICSRVRLPPPSVDLRAYGCEDIDRCLSNAQISSVFQEMFGRLCNDARSSGWAEVSLLRRRVSLRSRGNRLPTVHFQLSNAATATEKTADQSTSEHNVKREKLEENGVEQNGPVVQEDVAIDLLYQSLPAIVLIQLQFAAARQQLIRRHEGVPLLRWNATDAANRGRSMLPSAITMNSEIEGCAEPSSPPTSLMTSMAQTILHCTVVQRLRLCVDDYCAHISPLLMSVRWTFPSAHPLLAVCCITGINGFAFRVQVRAGVALILPSEERICLPRQVMQYMSNAVGMHLVRSLSKMLADGGLHCNAISPWVMHISEDTKKSDIFELDKAHSASLRILHVNPDCDKGNRLSLHAYLPRSISPENPTSHPFASGLSFSPTGGTRRRLNNINLNVRLAIDPNVMDLSHYTIQVDLGEEMRCGRSLHHLIGDLIK